MKSATAYAGTTTSSNPATPPLIQLAGADSGASGIPEGWVQKLTFRDLIRIMADQLPELTHA